MNFGIIILYIFLILYGLYCITFLSTLFYTIYKEMHEERILEEVDGFTDSDEENIY
tara:strand:- start:492 stop:659 length:168 start_codon:yes stop_codon:yes gene_type:complete